MLALTFVSVLCLGMGDMTQNSEDLHLAVVADACADKTTCDQEASYLLQSQAHKRSTTSDETNRIPTSFLQVGSRSAVALKTRARRSVARRSSRSNRSSSQWDCFPYPVSFNFSNLVTNNLGGTGPVVSSIPVMRFARAATTQSGQVIDFVVRATSPYDAWDPALNGAFNNVANINVEGGTSVSLAMNFMKTGTNQMVQMEDFDLTFLDINKRKKYVPKPPVATLAPPPRTMDPDAADVPKVSLSQSETETEQKTDLAESITVKGFHEYHISSQSDLLINKLPSGSMQFAAGKIGTSEDVSKYPNVLSVAEANRAVYLKFKNVTQVNFTLSVSPGIGGRTFEIAGKSSLVQCNAVPLGWGRPSCGVVPNQVAVNEVGYRTVLQGHPLCLEGDMTIFIRRVIKQQGLCVKDETSFTNFVKYFNGVCTMKRSAGAVAAIPSFNDLVYKLNRDVRRPLVCGGEWIAPCSAGSKPSLMQLPDQVSDGSGAIGKSAPLSEYGYRMVALTNSRTDMKAFIRRVCLRLDLKIFSEASLEGFTPHYLSRCGMQTFEGLVYELQLIGYALPCNCGSDWLRWQRPPN